MNSASSVTYTALMNIMCILFGVIGYGVQMVLWARYKDDVVKTLDSIKDCELGRTVRSPAQRFAIFLAKSKAKRWDSLWTQIGALLAPFTTLLPGIFGWFIDNPESSLKFYLNEPERSLYLTVILCATMLVLQLYIIIMSDRFERHFSFKQETSVT